MVWSGVVLLRRKPEIPWSSKQVSRMPSYASALIAYDGTVYARIDAARWSRDCTQIWEFLGLVKAKTKCRWDFASKNSTETRKINAAAFELVGLRPNGLSKSKKWGKISKSKATFCRSALLLSFCENRFCLSQFVKKLTLTKRGAFFDIFACPR